MERWRDNYKLQAEQAKKHFLTYDQQELIGRCCLRHDETYLYVKFLSKPYRIHRDTGDMERLEQGVWVDGNGFGEVMTILDWLCDSRADRYITGRWIDIVTNGNYFHGSLQEDTAAPYARLFDADPEGFAAVCRTLEGQEMSGADLGFAIELLDGLRVWVQLWHGDDEFPPQLRLLWDENTTRYLRYETTWFARGLLLERLAEKMKNPPG